MKRLIKSEIYDGFNKNENYYEVFKNPTVNEIEETLKVDGNIRGLLYKNGTIYIWPSQFDHDAISHKEIKMDFNQYHFFTEGKNWARFHMKNETINDVELLKAIDSAQDILGNIINLDSCNIEVFNYTNDDFEGPIEKLRELNMEKVSRLIKAIDFNRKNIDITPSENKTTPMDMDPQFNLEIKYEQNLIPLNLLNEADIKNDRCPKCKFHPLVKNDGFKNCPRCNSTYKMFDGKGFLVN